MMPTCIGDSDPYSVFILLFPILDASETPSETYGDIMFYQLCLAIPLRLVSLNIVK